MNALNASPSALALMPAWNSASFISATLTALAAQDFANFRILISDDASTDSTGDICRRFADADSRFKYVRQPSNLGWIGNVNALLSMADADYLFFAFHDDPPQPTYVSSLVAALNLNPQATLAFSDVLLERESGTRETKSYLELEQMSNRVERGLRIIRHQGLWWIPNRGLFRAEAARQVGGLHRHLAGEYSADLPWLLHLALLGEFVRVPQALIQKTWRNQGLSMSWKGSLWQSFGVAMSCAREIDRAPLRPVERNRLRGALAGREIKSAWWRLRGY